MIGSEAVTLMKRRMARFSSSTTMDDDVLIELKQAQTRLELSPELPWFILSERSFIDTVANEPRIIVPDDMIREYEEGALWVLDEEGAEHEIKKRLWDDIKSDPRFDTPARPSRYALVGEYFRLRPVPNAIYTVRMIFFQQQPIITLGEENNWLKWVPDLVIAEAGVIMASSYIKNDEAAKMFSEMLAKEEIRLAIASEAREHANHKYVGED